MALKHVAVIGAGVSGIVATKECLEQGIDVTCYEMHEDIGGIWYYTEHLRPDEGATVYDFLIANTSREMMRFSDFNFPPDVAVFPRHKEVYDYLLAYANHFDVTKHVKLNTKVIDLQKSENHSQNGKWKVVTQQKDESKTEIKEFDGVIVCNGFHRVPFIPDIEGFSSFQGKWSHSRTFKSGKHFTGKRVLVIGNANSALDTATGMSEFTEQVYLSVGQGCWVLPRFANRMTVDTYLFRRYYLSYISLLDRAWRNLAQDYFNHDISGMRCATSPLHHFPTVNDDIGSRIASGKIKVVPRTVKFLRDGVQLEDGKIIKDIDQVVFATGFKPDHSLLDEDTIFNSYKRVFPLNNEKPTLALVGQLSTTGSLFPTAELQARYTAMVFSGKKDLPSKDTMTADIKRWQDMQEAFFGKGKLWVPSLPLQDEIAQEIGVYPSFCKVLAKSPSVAFQTYFGPAFVAQYRILGEGKTENALEDCKNAWNLLLGGIQLRHVPELIKESCLPDSFLPIFLGILVIFVAIAIML